MDCPPHPGMRRRRFGALLAAAGAAGTALALVLAERRAPQLPPELQGAARGAPCAFVSASPSRRCTRSARSARGGDSQDQIIVSPRSWEAEKPRPPTLPAGLFRPKQSLSQNFLGDPNYVYKMVEAVEDDSPQGTTVLELGPGTGALTTRLFPKYPEMLAVELDQRAMRVLADKVPGCRVVRSDVLLVNYTRLSEIRGGKLNVVGNLPYHVTSQILFTLLDHAASINTAHATMQKEVADRILARPHTKAYGRISIAFQLYADVTRLFNIPPTAFFPRPNVQSTYLKFDFASAAERRNELNIDPRDLRNLTNVAFNQRNKRLRNSLKRLLRCHTTKIDELPAEYSHLRAGQLEPWEYVHLTQLLWGKKEFPKHFRYAWRGEFGRTVKKD